MAFLLPIGSHAQAPAMLRIGVLDDTSGPYCSLSGKGSVIAAQMAAEDFAMKAGPGAPRVEILSGDHAKAIASEADVYAALANFGKISYERHCR